MIYLTAWVCPRRHFAIALGWDSKDETRENVERKGEAVFTSGTLNRHCGICEGELHVEHKEKPFPTLAALEAVKPFMELGQLIARAEIELARERSKN